MGTKNVTIYLRETFDSLTDGMSDIRIADDGKVYSDTDNQVIDIDATVDAYLDQLAAALERQGYTIGEKDGRRVAHPDWHNFYGYGFHYIDVDEVDNPDTYELAEADLQEAIERTFKGGAYWEYTGEEIED